MPPGIGIAVNVPGVGGIVLDAVSALLSGGSDDGDMAFAAMLSPFKERAEKETPGNPCE